MTKILVADDERDIRNLLVDDLSDAGYDVIVAQDGSAAFDKACDESPDIILLDVMMPVMDGFQVLQKLKDNSATRSIPVIMVTAKGQEHDQQKAMTIGAYDYITKPWDSDEVESKVIRAEATIRK